MSSPWLTVGQQPGPQRKTRGRPSAELVQSTPDPFLIEEVSVERCVSSSSRDHSLLEPPQPLSELPRHTERQEKATSAKGHRRQRPPLTHYDQGEALTTDLEEVKESRGGLPPLCSSLNPNSAETHGEPEQEVENEDGDGVDTEEAVHVPWLVTDAFHVAMWYVLRYAGPALPFTELCMYRELLHLTTRGLAPVDGAPHVVEAGDAKVQPSSSVAGEDTVVGTPAQGVPSPRSVRHQWRGTDECELLLRLALRKPFCFTVTQLESRYGEHLHVSRAIHLLEHTACTVCPPPPDTSAGVKGEASCSYSLSVSVHAQHLVHTTEDFNATAITGDVTGVDAKEAATVGSGPVATTLLKRFDGTAIARKLLRLTVGNRRPRERAKEGTAGDSVAGQGVLPSNSITTAATPPTTREERELLHLLSAVRATDLRRFTMAVYESVQSYYRRCAQPTPPPSSSSSSLPPSPAPPAPPAPPTSSFASVLRSAPPSDAMRRAPRRASSSAEVVGGADRVGGSGRDGSVTDVSSHRAGGHSEVDDAVDEEANATARVIPTRKREIMAYLIERRYCVPSSARVAASAASTPLDLSAEGHLLSRCWDAMIGDVVLVPHPVKASVVALTELFHVVSANFGASGVLPIPEYQQQWRTAVLTVATAPTLLLMRSQLQLIVQQVSRGMRGGTDALLPLQAASVAVSNATERAKRGRSGEDVEWPQAVAVQDQQEQRQVVAHFLASTAGWLPLWWVVPLEAEPPSKRLKGEGASSTSTGFTAEGWQRVAGEPLSEGRQWPPLHQGGSSPSLLFSTRDVILFSHPGTLADYRAALKVHRLLYGATDGAVTYLQRQQRRDEHFVRRMYETVIKAVKAGVAKERQRVSAQLPNEGSDTPSRHGGNPSTPTSRRLEDVLDARGLHVQHLVQYLPLYRWYACVELLYPLLQSARLYDAAMECLHYLLDHPVYFIAPRRWHLRNESGKGGGGRPAAPLKGNTEVGFGIYYRCQKRAQWKTELARIHVHMGQKKRALQLLEESHHCWYELWTLDAATREALHSIETACCAFPLPSGEGTATTLSVPPSSPDAVKALLRRTPASVQRRARLLRALWPGRTTSVPVTTVEEDDDEGTAAKTEGDGDGGTLPAYHAVMEFLMQRYCRRADRLAMERTLGALHRQQRKWTPLPPRLMSFTQQLVEVPTLRVTGERDVMDGNLWRSPRSRESPVGVEDFVLRWYTTEWNRASKSSVVGGVSPLTVLQKDGGGSGGSDNGVWRGLHCEGAWIAYLARVLLWDVYYYPFASSSTVEGSSDGDYGGFASSPVATAVANVRRDGDDDMRWLSPFQEGPLDLLNPLQFTARRRRLVEERLRQFETWSKAALLRYAAERVRTTAQSPTEVPAPPNVLPTTPEPCAETVVDESSCSSCIPAVVPPQRDPGPPSRDRDADLDDREGNTMAECGPQREEDEEPELLLDESDIDGDGVDDDESSSAALLPPSSTPSPSRASDGEKEEEEEDGDDRGGSSAAVAVGEGGRGSKSPSTSARGSAASSSSFDSDEEGKEEAVPQAQPVRGSQEECEERDGVPTLVSTHTTSAPGNTGSSDTLAGRCAATAQHGLAKENHEVMRYEEEEEATNHGNGKEDGAAATAAPPTPFLSTGLSEAFKVDVGDFPLLHVLRAIPQRPLLKLLRHLYLSPMGEGYEIKFSGFPDLILWRDSDPAEPATAAATAGGGGPLPASWRLRTSESNQYDNDEGVKDASRFRLMEVKSPSDSLSTKQIAVNDCLKRCGFDVAVVRVVEVEAKRPPAGSVTRSGTAAPAGKAGGNRAPTTSSSPANLKRQQGKTPRRK